METAVPPPNTESSREVNRSPSPLIPLPLEEGKRRRIAAEIFALLVRSRVVVLQTSKTERLWYRDKKVSIYVW